MHQSQALKKSTSIDSSASSPFSFHSEIKNHSVKGNPKITKKITDHEKNLSEKECDFFTSPSIPYIEHEPDNDYIFPQGCYGNFSASFIYDVANILCHQENPIEEIKARDEGCKTFRAIGLDCVADVYSKDVIERYHCNKDPYLIKYRAVHVWYDCVPRVD
ncbi:hAT transposon superfamily [Striga asiatica]|uniref:HAT transposon superfamily n=1 Tax=Striga asiatica TaxID=4170 RepID=A0A5A7QRQ3_STRAF|nr:hAT transposon superfamily [Striga asiatica]